MCFLLGFNASDRDALNRIEALEQGVPSNVKTMVEEHTAWLDQQIDRVQTDIGDHINRNPELKHDAGLTQHIPGIGSWASAQFLAYIGDVQRFKSAKALAAFIGVTPKQKQSGSSIKGRTVISRAGHAAKRKSLYMRGLGSGLAFCLWPEYKSD
ncbi:MAG: IS110 family transposase [Salinisphaera sp.]|jgi:transposase|nr:IS110 family transposase [Salinisphaera sp.]